MLKIMDKIKWWLTSAATIIATVVSLFAYIQLDLKPFQDSTQLTVAQSNGQVFVRWKVLATVDEDATLIYYINDKQVKHYHYHDVYRHKWIDIIDLPLDVKGKFEFTAIWEFDGLKTMFTPEAIIFNTEVK